MAEMVEAGQMAGKTSQGSGDIYFLFRDSLLAKGVSIMFKEKGMNITPVDLKQPGAWEMAKTRFQPGDVVLVDKRDSFVHPILSIYQLFMSCPEIVIIGLDSCENKLEFYQKTQKTVVEPEELAGLIQSYKVG